MFVLHLPGTMKEAATVWDFLLAWEPEPIVAAPLLALGGLYLLGRRRLSQHSHRSGRGEATGGLFFVAGWLAMALALVSPIHTYSDELFCIHMVQHVLLLSVAAPLLLLANPMPAVLWGLPAGPRQVLGRELARGAWPVRVLGLLTRPVVAWPLFVLNLWLWHQPAAYVAALESEPLHYVEHLAFFGSAVLFWWPVIGPAPLRSRLRYPARMLYVFLAWLPNSILGAGFTFAPAALMQFYETRPRHWGIDVLTDQQLAGLVMWIPGDAIYAAAMMALLLAVLRQEDRGEANSAASPAGGIASSR